MKLVMCRLEYWEHIQCESFSSSMFDSEYFRRRVSNCFKSHDAWEWFMFNTCCQRAQSNTKTMEHNSTNQLSIVPAFALTVWHSKMHIHCVLPSRPFRNLHDGTQLGVWPQLGRHLWNLYPFCFQLKIYKHSLYPKTFKARPLWKWVYNSRQSTIIPKTWSKAFSEKALLIFWLFFMYPFFESALTNFARLHKLGTHWFTPDLAQVQQKIPE